MEQSASAEIQEEANALIINVNDNSGSQREANVTTGNESHNRKADREGNLLQDRVLADDITKMLERAERPLSPECCIYRVPHDLRKLKEKAYTPQYVSIGPFHHGAERLKSKEKLKVRYFRRFVKRAALNVENLVRTIRDLEEDVRCCYVESSKLSSDNYVKMILVDASFIIVFFLAQSRDLGEWSSYDEFTSFTRRLMSIVLHDIWLLENQLPFFVIETLYDHAFPSTSNYPSFTELTFEIFENYNTQKMYPYPNLEIMHFVDLLRTFFLPPSHILPERSNDLGVLEHLYTASQLHEAGVKFEVGSSKCLFDLEFTNGVLKIPCLQLYTNTESFFRNLVALEQCHYLFDAYVTDYILVLDFLIDTAKDVELLVRKKILFNTLGDSNAVTTLVNNLSQHISYIDTNSKYSKLRKDLNKFYENRYHRWKATLRRDYLSSPWRSASTVAAIILLVLTFIQTVCSIISLFWET
jgi:hypothetical protein